MRDTPNVAGDFYVTESMYEHVLTVRFILCCAFGSAGVCRWMQCGDSDRSLAFRPQRQSMWEARVRHVHLDASVKDT